MKHDTDGVGRADRSGSTVAPEPRACATRTEDAPATAQQLALRAQAGDALAFRELYDRLIGPIRRLLGARLGVDANTVEEVAHVAVTTALQALGEGRYAPERARFSTYAFGVAVNISNQFKRKLSAEASKRVAAGDLDGFQAPRPDDDGGERLEQIEDLLSCLRADRTNNSLTAEERFVILGTVNRNATQWQARQLGCGLATIHRRKRTALDKLRRCMYAKGHR